MTKIAVNDLLAQYRRLESAAKPTLEEIDEMKRAHFRTQQERTRVSDQIKAALSLGDSTGDRLLDMALKARGVPDKGIVEQLKEVEAKLALHGGELILGVPRGSDRDEVHCASIIATSELELSERDCDLLLPQKGSRNLVTWGRHGNFDTERVFNTSIRFASDRSDSGHRIENLRFAWKPEQGGFHSPTIFIGDQDVLNYLRKNPRHSGWQFDLVSICHSLTRPVWNVPLFEKELGSYIESAQKGLTTLQGMAESLRSFETQARGLSDS